MGHVLETIKVCGDDVLGLAVSEENDMQAWLSCAELDKGEAELGSL